MNNHNKKINRFICKFILFLPPLLISVVIIFLTVSNIYEWNNLFNLQYIINFLISFILIFFTIISLRKINFRIYFFIIFYSILFTLYLFEFFLENKKNLVVAKSFKSEKSKLELLKEKKNHSITIPPSSFINDKNFVPLSGVSNKKTIFCNEEGYFSKYTSDRYGFNNPDNVWKENENHKYILVGDSFTQGACLNRPFDIASQIRLNKPNKKIINLGYEGNGPLLSLATIREYNQKNTKAIFFLFFAGNDLENFKYEKNSKILVNYLNDTNFSQNLKNKQHTIDNYLNNYIKYKLITNNKTNLKVSNFIKLFNTRNFMREFLENYYVNISPLFEKTIIKMNENAILTNAEFYFVYLPEINMYEKTYYNLTFLKYKKIKEKINKLNINFIDLHEEVFIKENDPKLLFNPGNHYNKSGYNKVSTIISKYIK